MFWRYWGRYLEGFGGYLGGKKNRKKNPKKSKKFRTNPKKPNFFRYNFFLYKTVGILALDRNFLALDRNFFALGVLGDVLEVLG